MPDDNPASQGHRRRLSRRSIAGILVTTTAAVLVAAWLAGDHEPRPPHPDAPVLARLRLVAASEPATPESIAPYDESLVICEHEVLEVLEGSLPDTPSVRVAHWAVLASEPVPVPKVGTEATLRIVPFDSVPGIATVHAADDLPVDLETPVFLDQTTSVTDLRIPSPVRHDYNGKVSERLRLYWLLRAQLRIVVIGNSHAGMGVWPRLFPPDTNAETPVALNLASASAGFTEQKVLIDEYVMPLPTIEWIVWGLSPRLFNARYNSEWRLDLFRSSTGYRFDQEHRDSLWPVDLTSPPVSRETAEALDDGVDAWGGTRRMGTSLDFADRDALLAHVRGECDRVAFAMHEAAWEGLDQVVAGARDRGIRLLLFVPPLHPLSASAPAADPDGTGHDDLVEIVARLDALAALHDHVHFVDGNEAGGHSLPESMFWDIDHLNHEGARAFTGRLVEVMEAAGPVRAARPR